MTKVWPPKGGEPELEEPIWRNRPFMLLWVAQAISQTAQNAVWYGIIVLVQERSHSSTLLSIAIMTLIIPSVLFGILAGIYVDRWDKRAVLVGTNALRAVVVLGYVVFGEYLELVFAVNFVFSTIGQFFAPAEAAVIPAIVPRRRLLQANSLFHLTFVASQNIGIFLGGPFMVSVTGSPNGLFILVAVLMGVCAVLVSPLPRGSGQPVQQAGEARPLASLKRDVREVESYMRSAPVVRLAVGHWTLGAGLGLVVAMLAPGFAESVLGIPVKDSIFVFAPAGIGMLVGAALLGRFGQKLDRHRLTDAGLLVVACALVLFGLLRPIENLLLQLATASPEPPEAAGPWLMGVVMSITFLAAVGFVAIIAASQTVIQERVPAALRGRVFSVMFVLSNVVSILPLLFLGRLADLIGVGRAMILLGLVVLGLALASIGAHRRLAVTAW